MSAHGGMWLAALAAAHSAAFGSALAVPGCCDGGFGSSATLGGAAHAAGRWAEQPAPRPFPNILHAGGDLGLVQSQVRRHPGPSAGTETFAAGISAQDVDLHQVLDDGLYPEGRTAVVEPPAARAAHAHFDAGGFSGIQVAEAPLPQQGGRQRLQGAGTWADDEESLPGEALEVVSTRLLQENLELLRVRESPGPEDAAIHPAEAVDYQKAVHPTSKGSSASEGGVVLRLQVSELRQEAQRLRRLVASQRSAAAAASVAARRRASKRSVVVAVATPVLLVAALVFLRTCCSCLPEGHHELEEEEDEEESDEVEDNAQLRPLIFGGRGSRLSSRMDREEREEEKLRMLVSKRRRSCCWCFCNRTIFIFLCMFLVITLLGGYILWELGVLQPFLAQWLMYAYLVFAVGSFVALVVMEVWKVSARMVRYVIREFRKIKDKFGGLVPKPRAKR